MLRQRHPRAVAPGAAAPVLRACPAPGTPADLAFDVPGGRAAPGTARQLLLERDGVLPDGSRADVLLLLSELVANAVVHGGVEADGAIGIRVIGLPGRVRVEVTDPGQGFDWEHHRRQQRPRREGGFGLALVDRIADRWGIQREHQLTQVWFELTSAGP